MKMIMRYDGVLQPWYPAHKHPYLILQNSRICQHCDVKTSTVAPTFYYFFNIFLTCYISVPSFTYNLC